MESFSSSLIFTLTQTTPTRPHTHTHTPSQTHAPSAHFSSSLHNTTETCKLPFIGKKTYTHCPPMGIQQERGHPTLKHITPPARCRCLYCMRTDASWDLTPRSHK